MYVVIGWAKRTALAFALLALLFVVADHSVNKDRVSLGGENGAWTFGAAPSNGAGAEVCVYFSPAPSAFTSQQLGQVRCDSNQLLLVDVPGAVTLGTGSATIGSVTPLLPFNSTSDGQSGAANSSVGLVGLNSAGTNDRLKSYLGGILEGFANNSTILVPTSPTACTNISNSKGVLAEVVNANSAAQTVVLSLYDDSAHGCSSSSQIYQVILSSSASPILMIPLANGLAYNLSASVSANIVITYLK
jgi:hypothetical protein